MEDDLKRALIGELPAHLTPVSGLAGLNAALLKANLEKNRVRSALVEIGLRKLNLNDCSVTVESSHAVSRINRTTNSDDSLTKLSDCISSDSHESKAIYGLCFSFWSELEQIIILRNSEAMLLSILQTDLAELAILHLGLNREIEAEGESLAKLKSTVKNYISKWTSQDERNWLRESNRGKRRSPNEKNAAVRFLESCAASVKK